MRLGYAPRDQTKDGQINFCRWIILVIAGHNERNDARSGEIAAQPHTPITLRRTPRKMSSSEHRITQSRTNGHANVCGDRPMAFKCYYLPLKRPAKWVHGEPEEYSKRKRRKRLAIIEHGCR